MACYDEFPRSTVRYNAITLGGATLIGLVIVAQFGPWAAIGYLALLAFAAAGLLATVCARCGYYGRRCALGIGVLIPLLFRKGQEDEFARTASQVFFTGLLVLLQILPVAGGVTLLARGWTIWRLLQLVVLVGLLLAGLVPHPRLACRHCRQRERGACSIGCLLWRAGGSGT